MVPGERLPRRDAGAVQFPRRKHPRLELSLYREPGTVCSVTIAVRGRRAVFSNPLVAGAAVDIVRDCARRTGVTVYAYCVMPDHVHLVIEPSETCDIPTFVGQFKNLAQRAAWRLGVVGAFWQKSFWDHLIYSDEALERAVAYVLDNPGRAGLVRDPAVYPFAGSLVSDT